MGLERADLFITNACRCRPPGNCTPDSVSIRACRPYLKREVGIIRPRVIIALGRTAQKSLAVQVGHRGVPIRSHRWKAWIVFTWHPAYCLRQGEWAVQEMTDHIRIGLEKGGML